MKRQQGAGSRDEEVSSLGTGGGDVLHLDALIVGAGFAGLYMLYKLRRQGLTARAIEAGDDVGGTWYWNRYPGARCDVESVEYCYSFSPELDQEWSWSERFAAQPEIHRYLRFVADRFALRPDILFGTRVLSAIYDETIERWRVTTDKGVSVIARYCVMATGSLTVPNVPNIPGAADFAGTTYHTAAWPSEAVDFSNSRVGVIGTGSSGCQVIPILAQQAKQLVVFQRTANHCLPAHNEPIETAYYDRLKKHYDERRRQWRSSPLGTSWPVGTRSALDVTERERQAVYEHRWDVGGASIVASFADLFVNQEANDTMADFVRRKIAEIVTDPEVADQLMPASHPMGAKRVALVTDYYESFNRDNVRLVGANRAPIREIRADGVVAGEEFIPLDTIVYATGFDAITGALLAIDIRGRDGHGLGEFWAAGPTSYLGVMVSGLPNLFIVTGPGSPSVLSNVVVSIEQHVEWISDCIAYLEAHGVTAIEPDHGTQDAWMKHVDEVAQSTLFPKAKSWYSGDNIEGKPRAFTVYVGGVLNYRDKLESVVRNGYEGFLTHKRQTAEAVNA